MSGAQRAISRLKDFKIDLDAITEQLQVDAVNASKKSLDQIYATVDEKRRMVVKAHSGQIRAN